MGAITLLMIVFLGFVFYYIAKAAKGSPIIFSHWHHLVDNLKASTQEFYESVDKVIKDHQLPDTRLSRIEHAEGGVFSAKREYLRVVRREHVFDICAAPFGRGFFISWWLGEDIGWLYAIIMLIPLIGPALVRVVKPQTYYRIDTALMFQELVHASVLEVLDDSTKTQGLRSLTELERKPILRELFKR